MDAEQVFKELNLDSVDKKDICLQGCSAMTGTGIWEGIKQLSETISRVESE